MKIAILGWGSLIWNPKNIEIDRTIGKNGWFDKGPELPIEFARISKDGRLTLVIVPEKKEVVQTLYAISSFEELDHAVLDLAVREGCSKNRIGYYEKSNEIFHSQFKIKQTMQDWLKDRNEIEAVIWTDLNSNLTPKIGIDFYQIVVHYLKCLPWDVKLLAEQYIRRTPASIDTVIRKEIEKEFKWTKIDIEDKGTGKLKQS